MKPYETPENQNDFIQAIVNKSGVTYDDVVFNLPQSLSRMKEREYQFVRRVIFNQEPLIAVSRDYNMTLSSGKDFFQSCINKISCIMREMKNECCDSCIRNRA